MHPTFLLNPEPGLPLPFFDQVLYVMELRQDLEKGKATFTAVSEFLLTHPVLSFGVRDVAHSRLRHTEVLPAEEESESLTTGVYVYTGVLYFLIISVTMNIAFVIFHVPWSATHKLVFKNTAVKC